MTTSQPTHASERKRDRAADAAALPAPYVLDYRPYTGGQLRALQRHWHIPASARRDYRGKEQQQHAGKDDESRMCSNNNGDNDVVDDTSATVQRVSWDLYYRNNTVNGYKDRHYILREFHELRRALERACSSSDGGNDDRSTAVAHEAAVTCQSFAWLEAGCGVGNTLLPVLEAYGQLSSWRAMYAFDVSPVAIDLLQRKMMAMLHECEHKDASDNRQTTTTAATMPAAVARCLARKLHTCALDVRTDDVTTRAFCQYRQRHHEVCGDDDNNNNNNSSLAKAADASLSAALCVDFVTLIFVLCSIPVREQLTVLRRLAACLRHDGGVLFFRDYAACDHAQQRFAHRRRRRVGDADEDGESDDRSAKKDDKNDADDGTTLHVAHVQHVGNNTDTSSSSSSSFARTNGTLTHFFALDEVRVLFARAGLRALELTVVERSVHNRKTHEVLRRRFVQGRFCHATCTRDDEGDDDNNYSSRRTAVTAAAPSVSSHDE